MLREQSIETSPYAGHNDKLSVKLRNTKECY